VDTFVEQLPQTHVAPEVWRDLFASVPQLTSLEVTRCGVPSLLSLLPQLPCLTRLCLNDCHKGVDEAALLTLTHPTLRALLIMSCGVRLPPEEVERMIRSERLPQLRHATVD